GMARNIDSEHFLLARKLLLGRPGREGSQWVVVLLLLFDESEQAGLTHFAVAQRTESGFHCTIDGIRQLRAVAVERIHRARLDQAFENSPVYRTEVDALAEIEDCLESAALVAGGGNRLNRSLTHVLHRSQTEADRASG